MDFERIILCTDAPQGQGLAYYYYRALCDVVGSEKITILDEGKRNYGAGLVERGIRRVKLEVGLLSKSKYHRIIDNLISGKKNIVMLFNSAGLKKDEIKLLTANPDIYLINYLSDSPYALLQWQQKELFGCLPYFDLILIFAESLIPVLYQLGAKKVARIPFGYCKYTHLEPTQNLDIGSSSKLFYFGTWTSTIEDWLGHLTEHDLQIEGNGWHRASSEKLRQIGTKKNPGTDHNMAIMARKAGLVVNFTRAPHGCFHTMKTFELTAAGACVLSNYSVEQDEFYPSDQSMIYFNTPDEMVKKVNYFLNHPGDADKIAKAARESSIGNSYHDRVKLLLDILNHYNFK